MMQHPNPKTPVSEHLPDTQAVLCCATSAIVRRSSLPGTGKTIGASLTNPAVRPHSHFYLSAPSLLSSAPTLLHWIPEASTFTVSKRIQAAAFSLISEFAWHLPLHHCIPLPIVNSKANQASMGSNELPNRVHLPSPSAFQAAAFLLISKSVWHPPIHPLYTNHSIGYPWLTLSILRQE